MCNQFLHAGVQRAITALCMTAAHNNQSSYNRQYAVGIHIDGKHAAVAEGNVSPDVLCSIFSCANCIQAFNMLCLVL